MDLDATGKTSFDHIYTEPDPRAYFSALRELDYRIPEAAKPYFHKLVAEFRAASGAADTHVLDVGCSYGINAALPRAEVTMDDLYRHYAAGAGLDRAALLARDRELVRARDGLERVRFTGFDASEPALAYGLAAGFLDDTVHADLEDRDPTEAERVTLARADLVVSTGCVGYVTEKTLTRIAAAGGRRPWMAHFVLRMFRYDPVAAALAELGYETTHVEGVFPQRRFASAAEREQVLDNLADAGVDPTGLESDGRLYAELHISRPRV